jgi:hypothetical protein
MQMQMRRPRAHRLASHVLRGCVGASTTRAATEREGSTGIWRRGVGDCLLSLALAVPVPARGEGSVQSSAGRGEA